MGIRHKQVACDEFLCLPEVNPDHYEATPPMTELQVLLDGNERLKVWNDAVQLTSSTYDATLVQLHKVIDERDAEIERLRAENRTVRMDAGNYRSCCDVCGTANCDMLTDSHCAACTAERFKAEIERLRAAIEGKRVCDVENRTGEGQL